MRKSDADNNCPRELMATAGVMEYGEMQYRVMVHGYADSDAQPPHFHVSAYRHSAVPDFDLVVSLVGILSENKPVILSQSGFSGMENMTRRLMDFLKSPCHSPSSNSPDNLSEIIRLWNYESNPLRTKDGVKLLGAYFRKHNIKPLPQYERYLQ